MKIVLGDGSACLNFLNDWVIREAHVALHWAVATTTVGLLTAIVFLASRRLPASSRHLILVGGMFALLLVPLLSSIGQSGPVVPLLETAEARSPAYAALDTHYARSIILLSDRVLSAPTTVVGTTVAAKLFVLHVVVCTFLLARLGVQFIALRRLVRCSRPSRLATFRRARQEGERLMPGRGFPDLLLAPEGVGADGPLTVGMVRPVIVLPEHAVTWPYERLLAVMLHELAHVRRNDWASQVLSQVIRALFWFNPLVWWMHGKLRVQSEFAADDLVIAAGVNRPEYAEHLFFVHRTSGKPKLNPSAVAMARSGGMIERIQSILADNRPLGVATRRNAAAALLVATTLALPLATLGSRSLQQRLDLEALSSGQKVHAEAVSVGVAAYTVVRPCGTRTYDTSGKHLHAIRAPRPAGAATEWLVFHLVVTDSEGFDASQARIVGGTTFEKAAGPNSYTASIPLPANPEVSVEVVLPVGPWEPLRTLDLPSQTAVPGDQLVAPAQQDGLGGYWLPIGPDELKEATYRVIAYHASSTENALVIPLQTRKNGATGVRLDPGTLEAFDRIELQRRALGTITLPTISTLSR